MSRRRPGTAGSIRSTSAISALRIRPGSRPGSAREWFEAYNQRRNEEAWRMEEWKNTVNDLKKREWQTQFYNIISQPRKKTKVRSVMEKERLLVLPRTSFPGAPTAQAALHSEARTDGAPLKQEVLGRDCTLFRQLSMIQPRQSSDEDEWRRKEEKERKLADRRARLQSLLREDEKKFQEEREQKYKENRGRAIHHHYIYPEVEMLKCRLDDLKKKNQEERHKMSEALSYEMWKKNSPQVRQMESERFNHFIQEAWVNQRQWKEDERQRRAEEDRKREIEAAAVQQRMEEEEERAEEEKLKRQAEWKLQLEAQIQQIRERESRDDVLRAEELALERERLRLHEISQRRMRMKELRQRKELELFWARQYQLKLKKKASDIQQELLEDKGIVEDILRGLSAEHPDEQMKQRRAEAEWMRTVLEEQRRLEVMREKEYDLLFSEEAERLWQRRKAEWEKEQRARDKLMADVIRGLQQQVKDTFSRNNYEQTLIDAEKTEIQRSIIETREQMQQLEEEEAERRKKQRSTAKSEPSGKIMQEAAALRRDREEEERKLEEHRQEIKRLEQQMQQLWGPQYAPPHYGRKRFAW